MIDLFFMFMILFVMGIVFIAYGCYTLNKIDRKKRKEDESTQEGN